MKKVLLVSALVLVIATSMVSGTLALYNDTITTVDTVNGEGVTAKNFILIGDDTTDYSVGNLNIAPGETSTFTFTVSNCNLDKTIISEVLMNLSIEIALDNGVDQDNIAQTAITPLEVDVLNALGASLATADPLKFSDALTDMSGETRTYTVEITWPVDGENDNDYAGHDHGTALTVSVTGTQRP